MKIQPLLAPLVIGLLAQAITTQADVYQVNVRGRCKAGGGDKLTSTPFNTASILRDYAATQDPAPNVRDLKLVYDTETDVISIMGTNGTLVEVFSFQGSTSTVILNAPENQRERHVYIFKEGVGGGGAVGSAVLTERLTFNNRDDSVRLSSRGEFHYIIPETEETGAQICTGTFTLGKKLVTDTGE